MRHLSFPSCPFLTSLLDDVCACGLHCGRDYGLDMSIGPVLTHDSVGGWLVYSGSWNFAVCFPKCGDVPGLSWTHPTLQLPGLQISPNPLSNPCMGTHPWALMSRLSYTFPQRSWSHQFFYQPCPTQGSVGTSRTLPCLLTAKADLERGTQILSLLNCAELSHQLHCFVVLPTWYELSCMTGSSQSYEQGWGDRSLSLCILFSPSLYTIFPSALFQSVTWEGKAWHSCLRIACPNLYLLLYFLQSPGQKEGLCLCQIFLLSW
jgi:hypothetical protein